MYLEIDEGFAEHPKTLALCEQLDNPYAVAIPVLLWTWATRSCPDGDLSRLSIRGIERIVQWQGEPGRCYAALVACGFIEVDGDERVIHGWMERTGAAILKMDARAAEKRRAEREKKRRQREEAARRESSVACPAPVPEMSPGTKRDVPPPRPDQARPGQARQDQSETRSDPERAGGTEPTAMQVRGVVVAEVVDKPGGPPRTGYDVKHMFARLLAAATNMPLLLPSGKNQQKADEFFEQHCRDPSAMADIEPSMRLFFVEARGDPKRDQCEDPSHGFGFWIQRFPGLRRRLHQKPAEPVVLSPAGRELARSFFGR